MAWSNAFGSLAPNSQVVQTGDEASKPFWDAFRASMTASDESSSDIQNAARGQVAAAYSSLPGITPRALEAAMNAYGNAAVQGARTGNREMMESGFAWSGNPGLFIDQHDLSYSAPDFASRDEAKRIEKEFQDRQLRQSQSYGQMQGGNYFGGMLNEGYSDPFSGQVGAPDAKQGGLGGLGGMQPTETASWNDTWQPVAPQQRRAGSWGTAFGGW